MTNAAQIDYWNGPAGQKWVRDADRLDVMLRPFAEDVMSAAALRAGERVVDIGCGAGALSLMAANAGADVTGVDVSAPLLELARRRAASHNAKASFVEGDAAVWQSEAPFDALISRFGVMFFADPVEAFSNLRANLKPGGRLAFACWRPLVENDWAAAPLRAALPFLKTPPVPLAKGEPGPFAFAEKAYTEGILDASGWTAISVKPWDGDIAIPGEDASETADFMLEIGPLSRLVKEQELDPAIVHNALATWVREQAGPDGRTRLKAAAWIVEARA